MRSLGVMVRAAVAVHGPSTCLKSYLDELAMGAKGRRAEAGTRTHTGASLGRRRTGRRGSSGRSASAHRSISGDSIAAKTAFGRPLATFRRLRACVHRPEIAPRGLLHDGRGRSSVTCSGKAVAIGAGDRCLIGEPLPAFNTPTYTYIVVVYVYF